MAYNHPNLYYRTPKMSPLQAYQHACVPACMYSVHYSLRNNYNTIIKSKVLTYVPKVQSVKRVYVFMRVLFCNFISTVPPRKTGRLRAVGFPHLQHHTVNHSVEFVSRTTDVHTQNIESYWNRVKKRFKSMKGVHSHQLASYLDEFMWRERYGTSSQQAFDSILLDISLQYRV